MVTPYLEPTRWISYDGQRILDGLARAKAAVLSLQTVPFQRRWVDALQLLELKREVAGTSRIEGADFTERELDAALGPHETEDDLYTRSQRQARAALKAYEFIKQVPQDQPIDAAMILHIHRLMVQDADDDHCPPGVLRSNGQNVLFGSPKHRGVEGGDDCARIFERFVSAIQAEYRGHDPLIQAIAAHYHFAAMHPFLDGNGRTARALEALLLGRAGLRRTTFIAMSNYYYDEKHQYLAALAAVRANQHDLTEFLLFALKGVELQAQRLLSAIQKEIKRELFYNLMMNLFNRLRSPRKRVIAMRQQAILNLLLREERMHTSDLLERVFPEYVKLKNPVKALVRDLNGLLELGTIKSVSRSDGERPRISINLDWPAEITETEFFERVEAMPKVRENWGMGE